jgi:hypothetical protein
MSLASLYDLLNVTGTAGKLIALDMLFGYVKAMMFGFPTC